ncbi:MAG: hypothetical protein AB7F31_05555 [Parachlamydiales bacterium]
MEIQTTSFTSFIGRIKNAPSAKALDSFALKKGQKFNNIHWAAWFDRLNRVKPLKGLQLDQLVPHITGKQFSPGQLAQIIRCCGQHKIDNQNLLQPLFKQTLNSLDSFSDNELHILLTGLQGLECTHLICPLMNRFTADYQKRVSTATLAIWIRTCLNTAPHTPHTQELLVTAEERMGEFKVEEVGMVLNSHLTKAAFQPSLLQAIETQIFSFQALSADDWARLLPDLGALRWRNPNLVLSALSSCTPNTLLWDNIAILVAAKQMRVCDPQAKTIALTVLDSPSLTKVWLSDRIRFLTALVYQLQPQEYQKTYPLIRSLVGQKHKLLPEGLRSLNKAIEKTAYCE